MQPNAKKLILGLLLAKDGEAMSVRDLVYACGLFDISENSVRVTLVRLAADELIRAEGRAAYRLGPATSGPAHEVALWQTAEDRLMEWQGDFVAVFVAGLGRSDRKALKHRNWALELVGLRELERGLYLRPNNLQGGVAAIHERLLALGLEAEAPIFSADEFDDKRRNAIEGLWNTEQLNRRYQSQRIRLEQWLEGYELMADEVAARESYLLGSEAIRQLVFDPWLPEEMVDAAARHALVKVVQLFDETGKGIWRSLTETTAAMPVVPSASQQVGMIQ